MNKVMRRTVWWTVMTIVFIPAVLAWLTVTVMEFLIFYLFRVPDNWLDDLHAWAHPEEYDE